MLAALREGYEICTTRNMSSWMTKVIIKNDVNSLIVIAEATF
jgi:hypothetical protein